MNTGAFGEGFPYSNFHDLNMDWIIKIAKDFLDQYTHIQQIIEDGETTLTEIINNGETSLSDEIASGLAQLQDKADNLEQLLQAWYTEHSEDIANELADALSDLNTWYIQHQNYLNATLTEKINQFDSHADAKAQQTIDSIPDDYTELAEEVEAISNGFGRAVYFSGYQLTNPVATINGYINYNSRNIMAHENYRLKIFDISNLDGEFECNTTIDNEVIAVAGFCNAYNTGSAVYGELTRTSVSSQSFLTTPGGYKYIALSCMLNDTSNIAYRRFNRDVITTLRQGNNFRVLKPTDLYQGTWIDGSYLNTPYRIRTEGIYANEETALYFKPKNFKMTVLKFGTDGVYLGETGWLTTEGYITLQENVKSVILVFAKPNDSAITPSDYEEFVTMGFNSTVRLFINYLKVIWQYDTLTALPEKIYTYRGLETNVYRYPLFVEDNKHIIISCDYGHNLDECWRYTPTELDSADKTLTLEVFNNYDSTAFSRTSTIKVGDPNLNTGIQKCIFLGDSTTVQGRYLYPLLHNYDNENTEIVSLGTVTTENYPDIKCEGRGGWGMYDYINRAINGSVPNAFWNPQTSHFDFSYYMNQNFPDETVKYVFILLGINDIGELTTDAQIIAKATEFYTNLSYMESSIHAYSQSIKVVYGLVTPPSKHEESLSYKKAGHYDSVWRYKRNVVLFNSLMIDKLKGNNNIYVIDTNLCIDSEHNMSQHTVQVNSRNTEMIVRQDNCNHYPVEGGAQVADRIFSFIKCV